MKVYMYQADLYCEECGEGLKERIWGAHDLQILLGEDFDPNDETTWDSDEYPKGPYLEGGGESDSPCHCGSHGDCCNAITLENGSKVGAFLENPLTTHGLDYVQNAIQEFYAGG